MVIVFISAMADVFLFFVFENRTRIKGTNLPPLSLPLGIKNQAKGISPFHVFLPLNPSTFNLVVV